MNLIVLLMNEDVAVFIGSKKHSDPKYSPLHKFLAS